MIIQLKNDDVIRYICDDHQRQIHHVQDKMPWQDVAEHWLEWIGVSFWANASAIGGEDCQVQTDIRPSSARWCPSNYKRIF